MQGGQRHVRVVERKCASAVSKVNIIAAMALNTEKAIRVLMGDLARCETFSPTNSGLFSGHDGIIKAVEQGSSTVQGGGKRRAARL
jgi:hypothetical protein